MRPLALCCALGAVLSVAAAAEPPTNRHLATAEQLITELKFGPAAGELQQAWATEGNGRATVLRILELQGVVAANLKQGKKAEGFFRRLVALDPNHELSGDFAPRVMTPFFEAKSWAADNGAIQFSPMPPEIVDGTIQSVRAAVRSDNFQLAQSIRFHVRPQNGPWSVFEQPLNDGQARALIQARAVEWWAELLGDHAAQLALIASENAPLLEGEATPVAAAPAPAPTPVAPGATAPTATATQSAGAGPTYRPLAYSLLVTGAAAGGVGIYLGIRSQNDLSQINGAAKDSSGNITGITQARAYQLNQDSKNVAPLANALMIGGAALAVTGVTVWWLGRDTGSSVSIVPGPTGAAIAGTFP